MSGSLSRRTLLARGTVTIAAGVVGFILARDKWSHSTQSASGGNGYGTPQPVAGTALAALSAIPAGGGVVLASRGVVLTRINGTVRGFSSICTHEGCTLAAVSQGTIDCPCHGSKFNAETGAVVHGPATRPLPVVAVSVRGSEVFRT